MLIYDPKAVLPSYSDVWIDSGLRQQREQLSQVRSEESSCDHWGIQFRYTVDPVLPHHIRKHGRKRFDAIAWRGSSLDAGRIQHFGPEYVKRIASPHPLHLTDKVVGRFGIGIGHWMVEVGKNLPLPIGHGYH